MPTTHRPAEVAPAKAVPPGRAALSAVKTRHAARKAADLALVLSVVDWAVEHTDHDPTELSEEDRVFHPTAMALAGEGAPVVEDFALYQLAAALGRTIESTSRWVGHILETRYRLPRLWERLATGQVAPYRAFEIAEATRSLSVEGAAFVDQHLAPVAGTVSLAQLRRTVQHALMVHDPDEAARREAASTEDRRVEIDLAGAGTAMPGCGIGTVAVHAVLDTADALDLEHAIRGVATQLGDLGSTESLAVRRSQALGEIARTQLALDLSTSQSGSATRQPGKNGRGGRGIDLTVHLHPETGIVDLDQPGLSATTWLTQLRRWCQQAGTTVVVRPVIDLHTTVATTAYRPTAEIRRHVEARDQHCVAPYCTRPARNDDLDHIIDHHSGGPTDTDNLAPLCRRHHRAKTHAGWHYQTTQPGVYHWALPDDSQYTVDHHGTPPHPPD